MREKLAMAAIAALFAAPVAMPASAQTYINVAYSGFDLRNGANPSALTGRLGYDFNAYFAIEGEGSFGIIEDEGFELESEFGGFVLGKLPLLPSFHAFGRVGYSFVDSTLAEDDGLAYGIGGQYNWGKSGLRIEWTRHDYDVDDVDAWSIAYAYTF
jgi:hypothetical protein